MDGELEKELANQDSSNVANNMYTHNGVASVIKQLLKESKTRLIPECLQRAHLHAAGITYIMNDGGGNAEDNNGRHSSCRNQNIYLL